MPAAKGCQFVAVLVRDGDAGRVCCPRLRGLSLRDKPCLVINHARVVEGVVFRHLLVVLLGIGGSWPDLESGHEGGSVPLSPCGAGGAASIQLRACRRSRCCRGCEFSSHPWRWRRWSARSKTQTWILLGLADAAGSAGRWQDSKVNSDRAEKTLRGTLGNLTAKSGGATSPTRSVAASVAPAVERCKKAPLRPVAFGGSVRQKKSDSMSRFPVAMSCSAIPCLACRARPIRT